MVEVWETILDEGINNIPISDIYAFRLLATNTKVQ